MPSREYHCRRSMEAFGDPYEEVHRWLDGLAFKQGKLDLNHHRHRHHAEGIQEIVRMYGDKAARAARQHVLDDEGHIFTREEMSRIYPDCDELKTMDEALGKKGLYTLDCKPEEEKKDETV